MEDKPDGRERNRNEYQRRKKRCAHGKIWNADRPGLPVQLYRGYDPHPLSGAGDQAGTCQPGDHRGALHGGNPRNSGHRRGSGGAGGVHLWKSIQYVVWIVWMHTEFDMPKPQPQPQQPANGPQMDPNAANLAAQLEQDRAKLEQAAREKLAADRAKAEAEQKAAEAKAKAEQAAKEAAAKAAADKAKAEQQAQQAQRPAQRPAAQQHTTLKAGQVINLGDELRAQQAAQRAEQQAQRQPQPVADRQPRPVAAGNAIEGSLDELTRANGAHYTVQVVSASNRANIAAAAQGLSGRYWIVPSTRNGRPWYVLVFGDFPSRQAAMNAAAQVPTSVSQGASPFARRISEVQAEMRR